MVAQSTRADTKTVKLVLIGGSISVIQHYFLIIDIVSKGEFSGGGGSTNSHFVVSRIYR